MNYIGYFLFYLIFLFLETFGWSISSIPIKFDIMIPAVIFSVTCGGILSIFFTVFFSLITGLSQGFVLLNINFALIVYLFIQLAKNTFNISSKYFVFSLSSVTLFIKFFLFLLSKTKNLNLEMNFFYQLFFYVCINGFLSSYLFEFVRKLTTIINKYEKNSYNT